VILRVVLDDGGKDEDEQKTLEEGGKGRDGSKSPRASLKTRARGPPPPPFSDSLRPSPRLVIAAGQQRGGSLPCAF